MWTLAAQLNSIMHIHGMHNYKKINEQPIPNTLMLNFSSNNNYYFAASIYTYGIGWGLVLAYTLGTK